MFSGLRNLFGAKQEGGDFCSSDFKALWESFVDSFTDTLHARGPAVAAPQNLQEAAPLPSVLPAAKRLVAIGDLHGDLHKARRAFQLGGLIDAHDHWIGGDTVAVQVGDALDRGSHEIELLYWLERLAKGAAAAGGALHVLNGNHEVMNVRGAFRYATQGGFADFQRWHMAQRIGDSLKAKCGCSYNADILDAPADIYSNSPGAAAGLVTSRFLARYPTVLQIGSTLFVHGGVLPHHVEYGLDRINKETQAWMLGSDAGAQMPKFLSGRSAVVWSRAYSAEHAERCECDTLRKALGMVPGAKRMVVGHTIQEAGINAACDGQVYRIDVGMSEGCGGSEPEVLEILHDSVVRRIREADVDGTDAGVMEEVYRALHQQAAVQAATKAAAAALGQAHAQQAGTAAAKAA